MKDILQRELDGELIRTDDPEYEAIIGTIWKTMKLASKLNTSLLDVEENRKIFIEIFGKEYDESTVILPPFYVDYGKNITLGKNDWIQQGCTFMDRGGQPRAHRQAHRAQGGMMKRTLLSLLLAAACLCVFLFAGCGERAPDVPDTPDGPDAPAVGPDAPDISSEASIIVYFSATGNTERAANALREYTGAALYEIVPAEPYTEDDLNYRDDDCRANREQNDPDCRPAIAGETPGLAEYEVIYLGFPIWHGRMPKIMFTFLELYDLAGKTVMPFCTSGGSGISSAVREIAGLQPSAQVKEGLRVTDYAQFTGWLEEQLG